jgi:hypothetical protein
MRYDAQKYLDGLPADAIGELHLGGFTAEPDDADPGAELLVDAHATPVADAAWDPIRIRRASVRCEAHADRVGQRNSAAGDANRSGGPCRFDCRRKLPS